jgi:hypothetical protein
MNKKYPSIYATLLIILILGMFYLNNKKCVMGYNVKKSKELDLIKSKELDLKKSKKLEFFDAKISKNENNCLRTCTNIKNCSAVATDDTNNCYLSEYIITSKPTAATYLYGDEYKAQQICNKTNAYDDQTGEISSISDIIGNNSYTCVSSLPSAADQANQASTYDSSLKDIPKSSTYLVTDKGVSQINSFNEVYNLLGSQPMTTKLLSYTYPTQKGTELNSATDTTFIKIEKLNINKNLDIADLEKIYTKDYDYNGGDYIDSNCKINVDLDDCLNMCSVNTNCLGVEYNSQFDKYDHASRMINTYDNVCCLKKNITTKTKRPLIYKNGISYNKLKLNNNNKILTCSN